MPPPRRRRTDGARILLVEDTPDLRLLMEMALAQDGYQVDSADSAEAGVHLMERNRYDLVVSDYMLPNRSGAWLLREAQARDLLHGAATLLVTADPDAPEIAAHQEVVPKPVDFDRFLPQLRNILGQTLDGVTASPRASARAAAPVELVLYVSGASLPSARALRTLSETLARYDEEQYTLRVLDVSVASAEAAAHRIIFTPTLVKSAPPPAVWVLGDLVQPHAITDLLEMCGLEPRTPARTR